ncbi:hypothetical protein [Verminephrobacter aporrectodeae]|uniref:hypothetical protein n=1 Tax=Verminephrobacter aporrectodeae TaxID=1110389 RepID=UPI0022388122|nr:hypothetical protein [Verminephrobacter aporrectodeae]
MGVELEALFTNALGLQAPWVVDESTTRSHNLEPLRKAQERFAQRSLEMAEQIARARSDTLEPLRKAQERFAQRSLEMAEQIARARSDSRPPRRTLEKASRFDAENEDTDSIWPPA